MWAVFLPSRLEAYSSASVTRLGRWWPSATDGPASSGDEMRPLRHGGEDDMAPVSLWAGSGPQATGGRERVGSSGDGEHLLRRKDSKSTLPYGPSSLT